MLPHLIFFLAVTLRFGSTLPINGAICNSSEHIIPDFQHSGHLQKRSLVSRIGTRVLPIMRVGLAAHPAFTTDVAEGLRGADVMETTLGSTIAHEEKTPAAGEKVLTAIRSSPLLEETSSKPPQFDLKETYTSIQDAYERGSRGGIHNYKPINYGRPY